MTEQGSESSEPETQPVGDVLPVVYAELRRLAAAMAGPPSVGSRRRVDNFSI
jgi:hypothetical protein